MTQEEQKKAVAEAAIAHIPDDAVIGVGTGSTANHFIAALARIRGRIPGAVASSEATAGRLRALHIPVLDLNMVGELPVYFDGADEVTERLEMTKGGGGALTREKIVAAVADRFICLVDESKLVARLGAFPLPVEVIPMERSYVARRLVRLGGRPVWRQGFVTDNGNDIVDVHGLVITDAAALEAEIGQLAGVVTVGLFARRPADLLLVATPGGVRTLSR